MGRSDPYVFRFYRSQLESFYDSVAFLGFPGPNPLSDSIQSPKKDFFDLTLGNWEIDAAEWKIAQAEYDLVISTRCPYFSAEPAKFAGRCLQIARPGGTVMLDWGLGDHWRIEPYKVGWMKHGVQESVLFGGHTSPLWSCWWEPALEAHPHSIVFRERIRPLGYDDKRTLGEIIAEEVPHVIGPDDVGPARTDALFLWPESPQLYIVTAFRRARA